MEYGWYWSQLLKLVASAMKKSTLAEHVKVMLKVDPALKKNDSYM